MISTWTSATLHQSAKANYYLSISGGEMTVLTDPGMSVAGGGDWPERRELSADDYQPMVHRPVVSVPAQPLRSPICKLALLACWLMAAPALACAQQLPIKTYTIADGLVNNRISRIVRDSRGYLWFCTENGLSRFDGHSFTNYTTAQGLPDNEVDDILETRSGAYWIATGKGLCRYNPKGLPRPQQPGLPQLLSG